MNTIKTVKYLKNNVLASYGGVKCTQTKEKGWDLKFNDNVSRTFWKYIPKKNVCIPHNFFNYEPL